MGRRGASGKAEGGGGSGKKRKGSRFDDNDVQKPGKLMLNNPLIPADMDENIDDDLAFDSEDEALYGQFFSNNKTGAEKSEKSKDTKKSKRAKGKRGDKSADDEFPEDEFSAIDKAERRRTKRGREAGSDDDENLYNYHEDGQSSGDDDGDDYIDLSEMFDLTVKEQQQQQQKQQEAAKKKKKLKAKASKAEQEKVYGGPAEDDFSSGEMRRVAKKRRDAKVTEESESLYGMAAAGVDGGASSYSSALRTFVKGKEGESHDEDAVRQRLRESMFNKHNLLSVDADDPTKERVMRKQVRSLVEQNLEKYKPLLRELNTAKHVQFPVKAPDGAPTPSSIGGIVAAAEARFGTAGDAAQKDSNSGGTSAAGKLASRMNDLLTRAGLSRKQLQEADEAGASGAAAAAANSTDTIGDYVQFDENGNEEESGVGIGAEEEGSSRSYMAKLKSMLAYENSRRKRFNRIKSKTYRRILRKEKDREKERRDKAFELLHPELARKRLAEKLLKTRAEERITQKHKNTSAWVKHAKRFTDFDVNAKDAIDEQHALHQRLMQKMEQDAGEDNYERYAAGDGDNDSVASSEEERVVDELFAATAVRTGSGTTAAASTSLLWQSVDGEDSSDKRRGAAAADGGRTETISKARVELGQMKFMRAARDREEKEYEEQMQVLQDDIRRYQNGEDVSATDSDADEELADGGKNAKSRAGASGAGSSSMPGRMSFSAAKGQSSDKDAPGTVARVEAIQLKKQSGLRARRAAEKDGSSSEDDDDPVSDVLSLGTNQSDNERGDNWGDAPEAEEEAPAKAKGKKNKKEAKADTGKRAAGGEFAGLRKTQDGSSPAEKRAKKKTASTRVVVKPGGSSALLSAPVSAGLSSSSAANEEGDEGDSAEDLQLHQEYLISRAFAHDDVDEEFLKDKEAQVEAIMRPEDRNSNLPGWGEWGGEDQELNKRHQEKLAHTSMQKQIEKTFLMKSRADASLDHVIINHDGVELVPNRMTLHMVPRPFSNPQEFARSMRQPLGPEWSSALGFKEGVQPRVEVQQGHSVLPLDISLHGKKKTATKRRKTDVPRK